MTYDTLIDSLWELRHLARTDNQYEAINHAIDWIEGNADEVIEYLADKEGEE